MAHGSGTSVAYEGPCSAPAGCDAQDIRSDGACDLFLGYYWNGSACEGISGCGCEGTDCDAIYETRHACQRAYTECGAEVGCGGWLGPTCAEDEYCDFDGDYCDWADASGTCEPRPTACGRLDFPVCGCDNQTYPNPCEARRAGVDVAFESPCDGAMPGSSR
jgi:hypothetical protein